MQYISSDTNIWVDFAQINRLDMPFRLDLTYCMSTDTVADELLTPPGIREQLLTLGLLPLEMTEAEFQAALCMGEIYKKLSAYDRFALTIARHRGFILLTGDGALRRAAAKEGVEVRGTLWIFDQLLEKGKITLQEYQAAMMDIATDESGKIRLPKVEILKRLAASQQDNLPASQRPAH